VRTVLLDRAPAVDAPIPTTDPDVRTSWGDYLHHALFDEWAAEHLTNFNKWVKFIHTKVILVEPLTDAPTVITGSANYSDSSTTDNEENSIVIRGDDTDAGNAATMRVADIYLTEYQRLFMHFVFRDRANRLPADPDAGRLSEDDMWSEPYYEPGSWRARQRRIFAGLL
jgi:phosphatidylserine/phosphatidylglycerophosphate/cardiolipin synthase-like enzyme